MPTIAPTMDRPLSEAWVGRVLAWHHRHPLARRLQRAEVQGLGFVDLPYVAAEGAPRARWAAAFSEDFLPPHAPARVARWAQRHGVEAEPDDAWPRRLVAIDRRRLPPEGQALHLWVGTAALETPNGSVRVLISPTAPHAVLGRRLLSRPRMAVASLCLLALLALPVGAWRQQRLAQLAAGDDDEPPEPVAMAVAPQPASQAVPRALPAAPSPVRDAVAVPHAEAPAASAVASAPTLRAWLTDTAREQARRAVAQARRERALQRLAQGRSAWAVAAAHKRTPGESELQLPLMDAASDAAGGVRCSHVEVLPAGDDFRAVCWPFARREDAERVREQLAARGQAAEVVEF